MKNILNKLKRGFGLTQEPVETETAATVKQQGSFIPATAVKREAIIGFIIHALKPYVDEKSLSVAGLRFYISCYSREEEEAARIALCTDRQDFFKKEYLERKLVNHFIQLNPAWFFEGIIVRGGLPDDCLQQGNFGLEVIRSGNRVTNHCSKARLQVLVGQADQTEYMLDPLVKEKFYIGRSKSPQLSSGKIQMNDIVFLGKSDPGFDEVAGRANLHVSRNHAYIVYDNKADLYLLYPDKGGLPDNGNKLKVHTANEKVKWLTIYGVAHILQEGDQVELGGEAVLRFMNG